MSFFFFVRIGAPRLGVSLAGGSSSVLAGSLFGGRRSPGMWGSGSMVVLPLWCRRVTAWRLLPSSFGYQHGTVMLAWLVQLIEPPG